MPDRTISLLKSQRSDLADILETFGLSPRDCKWIEIDSTNITGMRVPVLVFIANNYTFGFDRDIDADYENEYWLCHLIPGTENSEDVRSANGWEGVLNLFKTWCNSVSREMNAEDPWEGAADEFSENFTESNESFTDIELGKLDTRLDAVKRFLISESNGSEATNNAIEQGIAELKESPPED